MHSGTARNSPRFRGVLAVESSRIRTGDCGFWAWKTARPLLVSVGELGGSVERQRPRYQNSDLMRISFEHQLRGEGQQLRALIASDPDLASIWRAGLAGSPELDQSQRDRFELLIVNVLNMLKAEYDGLNRGLATDHRATYLFIVAETPGFRHWWQKHRRSGRDVGFGEWIDSLTTRGSEQEVHAAQSVEPDVE